jgi:hypothetical protein
MNNIRVFLISSNIDMLRAIRHILPGSAFRFTEGVVILAIALAITWIVLGSFGRLATLKALLKESAMPVEPGPLPRSIVSLSVLNLLRVVVALAAVVSCAGAAGLSSSVWASTHISAADAARLWILLSFLACLAWLMLNWLLSTASLFVVMNQESALQAIASTVDFCHARATSIVVAGCWFGLAHCGAFISASVAGLTVFGGIGALGVGPVLFLEMLIALIYSIAANFLYAGRMAAYAAMIRGRGEHEAPSRQGVPPPANSGRSAVDQSELILSDAPIPAT